MKIYHVIPTTLNQISWFKNMSIITNKSHVTVTCISESLTHKMAAKTDWHRYGIKIRHCHCHLCIEHSRAAARAKEEKCRLGRRVGPDLQNILRQSYDYLTIMPTL